MPWLEFELYMPPWNLSRKTSVSQHVSVALKECLLQVSAYGHSLALSVTKLARSMEIVRRDSVARFVSMVYW